MINCKYKNICEVYNKECFINEWDNNIPKREFTRFRVEPFYLKIGTVDCVLCNFFCGYCFVRTKFPRIIRNKEDPLKTINLNMF